MDTERIDRRLIEICNERAFAGLAAGIVKDGRLVYSKGLGIADAALRIPVTSQTSFRIGSISKTFTAIGLMQLHEQERFHLDDPVNDYLKAYKIEQPAGAAPVTFRHLLTHTGGIGELRRLTDLLRPTFGLAAKPGATPSLRDYYAPALKADVAPGVKWAYANHGFATLGQLVEDISGRPFGEYMRENVFAPLKMDRTDYLLSERVHGTFAQGYRMTRHGLRPIPFREIIVGPAGSIFSSVEEMARYVAALLAGGANEHGRILKSETLAMMMSPQYQLDGRLAAMGLAFMLSRENGIRIVGHDGGWPGFTSAMWLAPDQGTGALAFTNTSALALDVVAIELLRLGLEMPEAPARPATLEPRELWSEMCGTYRPVKGFNSNLRLWMIGGAARVFVRDGHLRIGGRTPYGPIRRGLALHPADPADPLLFQCELSGIRLMVLFRRGAAGAIESLDAAGTAGAFATLHKNKRSRA